MARVQAQTGNIAEAKAWGGTSDSIPPMDDVVLEIVKAEQKTSPNKGTPEIAIEAVARYPEEVAGRKAFGHYYLVEKALPRLRAMLDASGVQVDAQGGFDDQDLVGKFFVCDIVRETYNKVNPANGATEEKSTTRIQNERPYVPAAPSTGAAAGVNNGAAAGAGLTRVR